MVQHYIEIDDIRKGTIRSYRFYGSGRWKIKKGRCWRTINAIYVPGEVLKLAASFCSQIKEAS
jgi:hypothetical protein